MTDLLLWLKRFWRQNTTTTKWICTCRDRVWPAKEGL